MFERYTEKARRAIFFARYECCNYGSEEIESEHLLLGLLRETALLQRLLKTGRESLETLRKEIEPHLIRQSSIPTNANVRFNQQSKRILEYAADEAERLSSGEIMPEHLVLGILREDLCLGARILHAHDVTPSLVRDELTRIPKLTAKRANEWCCAEFHARCFQAGKREHGLGILFVTITRAGTHFLLEYRRPDRQPNEPYAADAIKLKFCPWCGRNLAQWDGSGLPPFETPT